MKTTVTVLALALSMSFATVNAANFEITSENTEIVKPSLEVSPLCKAAAIGDIDKVKQLINNGVDVNRKSNGMLPIHYAAKFNRVDIIKVLITAGSKIHASSDQGLTALRYAEKTNATDAAQFLKRFKNKNA